MSNLDAQLREELRPELKRLVLQGPQPVVYVTHDQQEAMALADRIAVLRNGRIEQIGTPRELYEQPATLFVARFIGRPQMNLLHREPGLVVGIRPEHLRLDREGLPCRLIGREWLGAGQQLLLECSAGTLRMLCDGTVEPGDDLRVSWNSSDEHRFRDGSGTRLA